MSVNQLGLTQIVRTWIRQTILYNKDDIKTLFRNLVIIIVCTGILAYAWDLGWEHGLTWHTMYVLSAVVPGPPGPVFIAPLGFLVGLCSIFWLDSYKRLQGLFLLVPGMVALVGAIVFLDRLRITWTLPTVGTLLVTFAFGLAWGGLFEWLFSSRKAEMKLGFQRLRTVVAVIGLWGIVEATVRYESPLVLNYDSRVELLGTAVPVSFQSLEIHGIGNGSVMTSGGAIVGYIAVLGVLLVVLKDFTEYEMNKDILVLGPDRGGKTWLMAGAGYCLRQRAMSDFSFEKPELNDTLQSYHDIFVNEEFEHPNLEANDPDEFDFFSFTYEHGVLPKRRLRVNTIDYAGEHLQSVNLDDPQGEFENQWDGKGTTLNSDGIDTSTVPSFATLERLNWNGEINAGDIPSLLSAMIDEYDAIALTVPADEFAHELEDGDLPDHLTPQNIEDRRRARSTERSNATGTGYFQIYEAMLDTYDYKDLFFVITMSDAFLETYKQDSKIDHLDPKGNPNWHFFRRHVWEKIQEENERSEVHFMIEQRAQNPEHFYPVYFEPGEKPYYTQRGQFMPKLDWNDDEYYPLRGLKYLLKRMGR